MAGVTDAEIAALADDELPPDRRAQVVAAVAASPELTRKLAVQVRVAATIRAAAAPVKAPDGLRNPLGRTRP